MHAMKWAQATPSIKETGARNAFAVNGKDSLVQKTEDEVYVSEETHTSKANPRRNLCMQSVFHAAEDAALCSRVKCIVHLL